MGKASKDRRLDDKCAMALDRSVRSGAQKLNLVAASIRGMDVSKALLQLKKPVFINNKSKYHK